MDGAAVPNAVTITGTRSTKHRDLADYRDLFGAYLAPFALPGVRFYIGGASGIDSMALLWLANESTSLITVTVPATLADQPSDGRLAVATAREHGRLDELVELGGETRTAGYHARNRWMVDRSEFVIGFPRGTEPSGTFYTLNYAAEQAKPRLVVPV
jgi:predicted Rossmann fold nucleotide-binding protein DprA/Smf involved in DNA uptake